MPLNQNPPPPAEKLVFPDATIDGHRFGQHKPKPAPHPTQIPRRKKPKKERYGVKPLPGQTAFPWPDEGLKQD